jgi:hypothetical protein
VSGRIVRACRALLQVAPVAGPPPRPAGPLPAEALPGQVVALAPGPAGPLYEVPTLPAEYLERAELGGLRAALLGSGAVGLTGDVPGQGMFGQGGIGKTVLAAAGVPGRGRPACAATVPGAPPSRQERWPAADCGPWPWTRHTTT